MIEANRSQYLSYWVYAESCIEVSHYFSWDEKKQVIDDRR